MRAVGVPGSGRLARREVRKILLGLLFVSPWLVGFLWLQLYPILASLYYSFTDYQILGTPHWTGFANYARMFLHDPLFWVSVRNTLFFAAVSVPLGVVIGIALALLLNARVRGLSLYRTIYYLPTMIPVVPAVMLLAWLLTPSIGPVNYLLGQLGLPEPGWLNDPAWAKPALILLALWGVGGSVVIYLAGLQDIPATLYEAAAIDGAGTWQRTWYVTIPLLTPTILFNLVVGLIGAFQYFAQAYVAGAFGGPLNSLLFYNLYLYQNAFQYYQMGYASAMAWVLLVFVLIVTLAIFRTTGRWVHYAR